MMKSFTSDKSQKRKITLTAKWNQMKICPEKSDAESNDVPVLLLNQPSTDFSEEPGVCQHKKPEIVFGFFFENRREGHQKALYGIQPQKKVKREPGLVCTYIWVGY